MAKEIEFRFLCNDLVSKILNYKYESPLILHQGYMHVDTDQQIRIRLIIDTRPCKISTYKAFICVKHMLGDGVERNEFEYEIPYKDGQELFEKCKYKFSKNRYKDQTSDGYPIDIDQYDDGTVIAEVELPSRDTLFTKPAYFGENITGIHKYCNYAFAGIPENAYT